MRWIFSAALICLAFQSSAIAQSKDEVRDPFAAELYTEHCAQCHDRGADARVPPRETLEKLSPAAVLRTLETGVMREMGAKLTQTERMALAALLGKAESTAVNQLVNRCAGSAALPKSTTAPAWSGWSPGLSNWRFQDTASAKLGVVDVPNLKLKWAFAVPDATSMRSQPAVYAGHVFLAGPGSVYSLDAVTGCVFWATEAAAPIRSGLTVAALPEKTLVIFGDDTGYLRALDASTGAPVWQLHADDNPAAVVTSTPAYFNGRLYVGVSSTEEGRAITMGYVC
jgi:polyvinyl alcohol dehydrogenase (cytochrome)